MCCCQRASHIAVSFVVLLFATMCASPPLPAVAPTAVPSADLARWLEQAIDYDSPQTRISSVTVRLQQTATDGIFVLYSYEHNRQGFREAMTCVQRLSLQRAVWQRTDQGDCISTFPDDPSPLPTIVSNGYAERQDRQGQHYTLTFGLATQPTAQRITVSLQSGAQQTTEIVNGSFLVRFTSISKLAELTIVDSNNIVIAQKTY